MNHPHVPAPDPEWLEVDTKIGTNVPGRIVGPREDLIPLHNRLNHLYGAGTARLHLVCSMPGANHEANTSPGCPACYVPGAEKGD